MIKLIVSAIWICAITLVSSYVAASWKAQRTIAPTGEETLTGLNYTKTDPDQRSDSRRRRRRRLRRRAVRLHGDAATLNKLSVPPDPFILDEAFRSIFSDEHIDFAHLERFDIAVADARRSARTSTRVSATDLIQDMLVEQFTFVSKDEVRAQAGATADIPVVSADTAVPAKPAEDTLKAPEAVAH